MSITKENKQELINQYKVSENDTGSAEVQCAILTQRINNLASHFKDFPKDLHSRRGLLGMVEKRRKLIKYLRNNSQERYLKLIKDLGIRK